MFVGSSQTFRDSIPHRGQCINCVLEGHTESLFLGVDKHFVLVTNEPQRQKASDASKCICKIVSVFECCNFSFFILNCSIRQIRPTLLGLHKKKGRTSRLDRNRVGLSQNQGLPTFCQMSKQLVGKPLKFICILPCQWPHRHVINDQGDCSDGCAFDAIIGITPFEPEKYWSRLR